MGDALFLFWRVMDTSTSFAGNDQLLTCEQAAVMLQIPEDTLRTWRTVRGIGGHKKASLPSHRKKDQISPW